MTSATTFPTALRAPRLLGQTVVVIGVVSASTTSARAPTNLGYERAERFASPVASQPACTTSTLPRHTCASPVGADRRVDRRAAAGHAAHGSDVDDQGNGTVTKQQLYHLIRQPGPHRRPIVRDRVRRSGAWKRSRSRSADASGNPRGAASTQVTMLVSVWGTCMFREINRKPTSFVNAALARVGERPAPWRRTGPRGGYTKAYLRKAFCLRSTVP